MTVGLTKELLRFVESFGCVHAPGEDQLWVEQLERLVQTVVETYRHDDQGFMVYIEQTRSTDLWRMRVGAAERSRSGELNLEHSLVLEDSGWVERENWRRRAFCLADILKVVVKIIPPEEFDRRCTPEPS